jgi:hypothetical protein
MWVGIVLNLIVDSQKPKVSFWLAEELSDAHWLNANKDTKVDIKDYRQTFVHKLRYLIMFHSEVHH